MFQATMDYLEIREKKQARVNWIQTLFINCSITVGSRNGGLGTPDFVI